MVFLQIAITSDMDIVILGVQKLSFGRPSASILQPWEPFCQLRDALGTMGAADTTHWAPEADFY